jgi:hypothetical protein
VILRKDDHNIRLLKRQVYTKVCNPNFDSNLRNLKKFQQTGCTKTRIQKGLPLTNLGEFDHGERTQRFTKVDPTDR